MHDPQAKAAEGSALPEASALMVAPLVPATNGAYTQREQYLLRAEEAGDLAFEYVVNNGDPHNSLWCALGRGHLLPLD
jgi:hypothetical protein